MQVTRVNLEKVKLTVRQLVSKDYLGVGSTIDVAEVESYIEDHAAFAFKTYIVGITGETAVVFFDVPDTWWDAFKLTYFTPRMLRRWPEKTRRLAREVKVFKAVCPHINIPDSRHIHFLTQEQVLDTYGAEPPPHSTTEAITETRNR